MVRHTLVSVRDLAVTAGPFLLLALLLLIVAYWLLDPSPPRRMVMATGAERGAYAEFGARYAKLMAHNGIKVELRNTQGAVENLALLRDPNSGVDVAFVQGGVDSQPRASDDFDDEDLTSLGSLFYEPVWLFYREDAALRLLKSPTLTSLSQLPGWRINGGTDGSGTRLLLHQLLEANALDPGALNLLKDETTPAVVALLEGRIDALVFVSAPESLMVQMLLRTPGVRLFDFAQAEAYARRFSFLSAVVLPRGIVDLARDQPPQDVHLVATHRDAGRARRHASGAAAVAGAGRSAGARRRGLVPAQGRLPQHARHHNPDSPPRPRASTGTGGLGCSATCRSGWPT